MNIKKQPSFLEKLIRLFLSPKQLIESFCFHLGRIFYPRYKRPKVILFRYTKALGDNLMLTTVAREVRKRNPKAYIHVVTGLPEIFERNPDVDQVTLEPEADEKNYGKHLIRYEHRFPWKKHLLEYCADCVDIHDKIDLKTYIFPNEEDRRWAQDILKPFHQQLPILVNRMAGPRTDKKNWPTEYWQKLIEGLIQDYPVFDIGSPHSPKLSISSNHWVNLLGQTNFHQLAALMEQSRLLIGPISGPLHLASACNLPTLAIVGGSENALGTQYPKGYSLMNRPDCKDCYEQGPCEFDFKCLWAIKPEEVLKKTKEILGSRVSV